MLKDFNKFLNYFKPRPVTFNCKKYNTETDEGEKKRLNDLKMKVDSEFCKHSVGGAFQEIERMYNNIEIENLCGDKLCKLYDEKNPPPK
jgi:hypothetical protein